MSFHKADYYTCDRCGKTIKETDHPQLVIYEKGEWMRSGIGEGKAFRWDYCNNCLKEVMKILRIYIKR